MTAPAAAPTPQTGANPQSVKVTVTEDTANGTESVILEGSGNSSGGWLKAGTVTARDSDAVILKHSQKNDNKAGTFVAIPTKRWKPVKVTPETVTTLKLEEAKS